MQVNDAIIFDTNGIYLLTYRINMDLLDPFLNQISFSARVFFSGELCNVSNFDDSKSVGHIHLIKSGNAELSIKNKTLERVTEPCVLFFPRPCRHSLAPVDDEGFKLLCASIDLGINVRSPLAIALPEVIIMPINEIKPVKPSLDLIFDEAFKNNLGRQAALDRLVEYFFILLLRHIVNKKQLQGGIFAALADSRLSNAVNAMHEKPSHPWTLDALADVAGMSRARFAANFKRVVGITPLNYLTDWRISIAQNLIKEGRPIKSVASHAGYQNQVSFTRVFTKKVGISPVAWSKQF